MRYILVLLLCCFGAVTHAQKDTEPAFKGGWREYYSFSTKQLKATPAFTKANVTGITYVRFRVTVTGEVDSIRIVRPFGFGMDEEAIRVLKLTSGNWIPAQKSGKQIASFVTVPFRWHPDE
ncbi:energy transducer TonB [Fibrella forsythiae]|uniref:Energy transducer TonB n=1 Tax=Fibrella forsythiae TaxID=2817061 RepID=A0ABS3JMQ6_9BACT|nr:energy transducer TonB [Fibrella forsythiae]MBO0950686.1 energy transducer TonB [Fibrella forsythiae]